MEGAASTPARRRDAMILTKWHVSPNVYLSKRYGATYSGRPKCT